MTHDLSPNSLSFSPHCVAGTLSLSAPAPSPAPARPARRHTDGQKPGATAHKDVKEQLLGQIDLSKEKSPFQIITCACAASRSQPGGEVAWHSHGERPALIYVVSGSITEYSSHCQFRSCTRRASFRSSRAACRTGGRTPPRSRYVLISADIAAGPRGARHVSRLRAERDVTPCATPRHGLAPRLHRRLQESLMTEITGPITLPRDGQHHGAHRRNVPICRDRHHGLSDRRRSVRDAGAAADRSSSAMAFRPAAMGLAVNACTLGMAAADWRLRFQPAHRPAGRNSRSASFCSPSRQPCWRTRRTLRCLRLCAWCRGSAWRRHSA